MAPTATIEQEEKVIQDSNVLEELNSEIQDLPIEKQEQKPNENKCWAILPPPKTRLSRKSVGANAIWDYEINLWFFEYKKEAELIAEKLSKNGQVFNVGARPSKIVNGLLHGSPQQKKTIKLRCKYEIELKEYQEKEACFDQDWQKSHLSKSTIEADLVGDESDEVKKQWSWLRQKLDGLKEEKKRIDESRIEVEKLENAVEKNKIAEVTRYGNFIVKKSGLYFSPEEKNENESDLWISSPIWPEAHLRNKDGRDHSLLLRVNDGEREHFWAMPKRLITKISDINDVLLDFGQQVPINTKEQKLFQTFLMKACPSKRLRCVDKSGWHGQQYIFPDGKVIGTGITGEGVYPLNDICPRGIEEKGTFKEWQDNVLRLCKGNSRLLFSIGTAFASLCLIDEDSGGFNLKGRSSIGKTKCLRVAISVIGSRDYQRSWKTTSNGLEGVCALHNDSLLPLDEFGQQDAAEAGEIAYMVASGVGKQRASRDGSARDPRTWRVLVLSTGETGLEGHMREGRKKVRAGQLARITDIPADACKGLGCFENVHGLANGGDFADELDRLCSQYYGTASRAYIQEIVKYGVEKARQDIRFAADDFVAEKARNHDGQVQRVARRFGLVYAALVLSAKLGVTPDLTEEESKEAVTTCYKAWLADRGTGGALENHSLVEQVIGALRACLKILKQHPEVDLYHFLYYQVFWT